jgi:hypothetical protein
MACHVDGELAVTTKANKDAVVLDTSMTYCVVI